MDACVLTSALINDKWRVASMASRMSCFDRVFGGLRKVVSAVCHAGARREEEEEEVEEDGVVNTVCDR